MGLLKTIVKGFQFLAIVKEGSILAAAGLQDTTLGGILNTYLRLFFFNHWGKSLKTIIYKLPLSINDFSRKIKLRLLSYMHKIGVWLNPILSLWPFLLPVSQKKGIATSRKEGYRIFVTPCDSRLGFRKLFKFCLTLLLNSSVNVHASWLYYMD